MEKNWDEHEGVRSWERGLEWALCTDGCIQVINNNLWLVPTSSVHLWPFLEFSLFWADLVLVPRSEIQWLLQSISSFRSLC